MENCGGGEGGSREKFIKVYKILPNSFIRKSINAQIRAPRDTQRRTRNVVGLR